MNSNNNNVLFFSPVYKQPVENPHFSRATLDKLLMVTAKCQFVLETDQPNRQVMLDQLCTKAINHDDKVAFSFLSRGKFKTLKDYLLFRAQQQPTQTLPEILSLLNYTDYSRLDQHHLLTNLIHAHLQDTLTIYELASIIQKYSYFKLVNKFATCTCDDPKIQKQFAAGVVVNSQPFFDSNTFRTEAVQRFFWHITSVKNEQWPSVKINPSRYPILDELLTLHMQENKPRSLDRLSRWVDSLYSAIGIIEDDAIPLLPIHILQQFNLHDDGDKMIAMPVIGCYDWDMLERAECDVIDGVSMRPITLPSYLAPELKALFYGAYAGADGRVQYGGYDVNNPKPGFKDMTTAHNFESTAYGILFHDLKHIKHMLFNDPSLNLHLFCELTRAINALLSMGEYTPQDDLARLIEMQSELLDNGYGSMLRIINQHTSSKKGSLRANWFDPHWDLRTEVIRRLPQSAKDILHDAIVRDGENLSFNFTDDFREWFTEVFGRPFMPKVTPKRKFHLGV